MTFKIIQGDALEKLKELPEKSVDMVMTSPPYWAMRDYHIEGQLGLEKKFEDFIEDLCDIFDEVKRVLKDEGTCWVNLGDSYPGNCNFAEYKGKWSGKEVKGKWKENLEEIREAKKQIDWNQLPKKSLMMIPFRFAIEMVNRGWILRNNIIWHKPNAMPSSAKDRFNVDFEYLFLFSKQQKYYFKIQREPHKIGSVKRTKKKWEGHREPMSAYAGMDMKKMCHPEGRNKRCVWTINTKGIKGNHYATYPEELCETPIKAGCPKGGTVLDPFGGAGTTALVAEKQGKNSILIELNPEYCDFAKSRLNTYKGQTRL